MVWDGVRSSVMELYGAGCGRAWCDEVGRGETGRGVLRLGERISCRVAWGGALSQMLLKTKKTSKHN